MTDKDAMKLALEALELLTDTEQTFGALDYGDNAIAALNERLAQPEQEPFAIVHIKLGCIVGSHRDQNKLFPDGQYGLWPVATPPAQPPQPEQEADELTIAYMSGLYDGKKAQPEQEPVAILNHAHGVHTFRNVNLKGLPDGEYLVYTFPPQRTEEKNT